MLKKIVKVRNVGRLRNANAVGDVEFRAITLVFGENSRGKTTLCDLLRSVKTGNGDPVVGRTTLPANSAAEVDLLFDDGLAAFRDGAWSATHPEFEIFDTTFVHENVHAGDYVEHAQKRNLFRVIVGEEGIRLTERVDELDACIRQADGGIRTAREAVQGHAPAGVTVDTFVALTTDPEVDAKIREARAQLQAFDDSAEIARVQELDVLVVPALPGNLETVLRTGIQDLTRDAVGRVHRHVRDSTEGATEAWLAEGLRYRRGETCPFCGQSLVGVELVAAFGDYFSDAYTTLRDSVEGLGQEIARLESDALGLSQAVGLNDARVQFWTRLVRMPQPTIDAEEVREAIINLATNAAGLVRAKLAAPVEPVTPGTRFSEAQERYMAAVAAVNRYNQQVSESNACIRSVKATVATGGRAAVQTRLSGFEAVAARFQPGAVIACGHLQNTLAEKSRLERDKDSAKGTLDTYTANTLQKFESRINVILKQFGAGFQIGGTTRSYMGGRPSSSYAIVINDVSVALGDDTSSLAEPSFRNTLSAGDRSALALAFFIARCDLDSELRKKILVFDDPFGSQDASRRACTQQLIANLASRAAQVVVLSHERSFLRGLWEVVDRSATRVLQIARVGAEDSNIVPWDIEAATEPPYLGELRELKQFADAGKGEPRGVARRMRIVLEDHLKFNSPRQFSADDTLGVMNDKIRDADETSQLAVWKPNVADLDSINLYSRNYHHASNPRADAYPIDVGELTGFVRRTLALVGAA